MLSEKELNEILSMHFSDMRFIDKDQARDAINEALALADKSRWKYPDKGELPKILADYIIFYLRGRLSKPKIGMAYKDKDGNFMFFCNDTKQGYSQHEVKAWAYAPVLDEEPLPRSERLEKLTAERDALLEEDRLITMALALWVGLNEIAKAIKTRTVNVNVSIKDAENES